MFYWAVEPDVLQTEWINLFIHVQSIIKWWVCCHDSDLLHNAPYKDTGHGVPDELGPGDDWVSILVTHSQDLPATRGYILNIQHRTFVSLVRNDLMSKAHLWLPGLACHGEQTRPLSIWVSSSVSILPLPSSSILLLCLFQFLGKDIFYSL